MVQDQEPILEPRQLLRGAWAHQNFPSRLLICFGDKAGYQT